MSGRIWLIPIILYAVIGVIDGMHDFTRARSAGEQSNPAGALAVAFCAGLFWPIDIVARPLLMR